MKKFTWAVVEATPHEDYTIDLVFDDGRRGVYDARALLDYECYAPLRNIVYFMTARADHGTIAWDYDMDAASEDLYAECEPAHQEPARQ